MRSDQSTSARPEPSVFAAAVAFVAVAVVLVSGTLGERRQNRFGDREELRRQLAFGDPFLRVAEQLSRLVRLLAPTLVLDLVQLVEEIRPLLPELRGILFDEGDQLVERRGRRRN